MATLFISDMHLDARHPEITRQFLHFLDTEALQADALYILGDLFELWIGDDDPDPEKRRIIAALRAFTDKGIPCFVMQGNRDFLYGEQFARDSGCQLLEDPVIVHLYGERVLVTHGDALCTDDRSYQNLRAMVRDPGWQRMFLKLRPEQRLTLAEAARAGSKKHIAKAAMTIMDVNNETVAAAMKAAGVTTLLHGHTHRPAVHRFTLEGKPATRIVLGDWYDQGSVLRWDANGFKLEELRR
jgi:UDP-2,3-diacylglucosamine hydrolase